MLKKWDRVLFSSCPKMNIPYKEYIVKSDERENPNFWSNTVFLEWYSGFVDAKEPFCIKIVHFSENINESDVLDWYDYNTACWCSHFFTAIKSWEYVTEEKEDVTCLKCLEKLNQKKS